MSRANLTRRALVGAALATPAILSTRAFAQGNTVRIGCIQTLTGPVGDVGQAHLTGAEIAIEAINEAGGIDGRPVEMVVRDGKMSSATVLSALREFQGSGINLVVGESFTALNLATVPLLADLGLLMICPTTTSMTFTHEGFTRNFFRAGPNNWMQYNGEATYLSQQAPNISRWGGMQVDGAGYELGWNFLTTSMKQRYAENAGTEIEILDPIVVKADATDYRVTVSRLMADAPEGLIVLAVGGPASSFLRQAKPFGLLDRVGAIADTAMSVAAGPTLGDALPENFYTFCMWHYDAYKEHALASQLRNGWQARAEGLVNPWAANAHTAIMSLAAGVAAAGSDETQAVIEALEGTTFASAYGEVAYRAEDHQLMVGPGFMKVAPTDDEQGWQITDYQRIPWELASEPASPGEPFSL